MIRVGNNVCSSIEIGNVHWELTFSTDNRQMNRNCVFFICSQFALAECKDRGMEVFGEGDAMTFNSELVGNTMT